MYSKMKRIFLFLAEIFFLSTTISQGSSLESPSRSKINLNREWKFQLGDHPGAEKPGYADANWQKIGLPHSFSIPYFLSPDFYTGYGWYRKHISMDKEIGERRYSLEFEGVFQVAEVFVNGTLVGNHRGGYNGFPVDITKTLHKGDNIIAVRVNNIWDAQLAPRAGEHVFSGGIYRDVWLVETDPVHVAWYGTFVTTPGLSEASGKVNVKAEISNDGLQTKKGTVITTIFDPKGEKVGSMEAPFSAESGKTVIIDQTSSEIIKPELWSPASPVLYKAVTSVMVDNKIVDSYETPFGMRWIEWTADKGFFLNGKHQLKIRS